MRKLRSTAVVRDLEEIRRWIDVLIADCPTICRYANEWMDDGVSGISYSDTPAAPGHSDAAEGRAEAQARDRVAKDAARFGKQLNRVLDEAKLLRGIGWALLPMDREQARILAESDAVANKPEQQTLQAQCANPNCGRLVARTVNDRLRGGRCNACRMYLDRNGMERPRHYCARDEDVTGSEALGLDTDRLIVEGAA